MVTTRSRTQARAAAANRRAVFIDKLNDELLLNVFETLAGDSKSTVLAATVVCTKWHALAQTVIDGDVGPITIGTKTEERNTKLFERMKRDAGFQQRIHHLSIGEWYLRDMDYHLSDTVPWTGIGEDPFRAGGYFSRLWTDSARQKDPTWSQIKLLADAVVKLSLSTFSWSATSSMPQELAQALAKDEECAVRIYASELAEEYMMFAYAPFSNHWYIESLKQISRNLTSLSVSIPAADTSLLRDLGHLIWTSARLRELRITAIGCIWYPKVVPHALRQTPFGEFQTVTDLSWLLTPVAAQPVELLRFSNLELSNVCICADPHHLGWTEHVDWNRLESLTVTCVALLELVTRRTNRVASLTLTLPSGRDCEFTTCASKATVQHTMALLSTFTALRYLELINGTAVLTPSLVIAIGRDLRSLIVHERTQAVWQSDRSRPLISIDTLQQIRRCCTKLSCLAIDVPYSDIPYLSFIYEVASTIPSIRYLTVYREIEARETDIIDPPRSAVTNSTVQNDFIHLRRIRSSLVRLDIKITSMPPFYLDKLCHGRGNPFTFYQRHLVVEHPKKNIEEQQQALQTRSMGADRITKAVSNAASGPRAGHWEADFSRHRRLAEDAYDFYWKPAQPY